MTYVIKWRPKTLDDLRALPKENTKQLVKRIDLAKENPFHFLEKLVDDPGYKIRAGDYRVIVDLDPKNKIIFVRFIGHRKNIYKQHL